MASDEDKTAKDRMPKPGTNEDIDGSGKAATAPQSPGRNPVPDKGEQEVPPTVEEESVAKRLAEEAEAEFKRLVDRGVINKDGKPVDEDGKVVKDEDDA